MMYMWKFQAMQKIIFVIENSIYYILFIDYFPWNTYKKHKLSAVKQQAILNYHYHNRFWN